MGVKREKVGAAMVKGYRVTDGPVEGFEEAAVNCGERARFTTSEDGEETPCCGVVVRGLEVTGEPLPLATLDNVFNV